jgi:hypothetical protein
VRGDLRAEHQELGESIGGGVRVGKESATGQNQGADNG